MAVVRQGVMVGWSKNVLVGKQDSSQIHETGRKKMTDLRWGEGLVKKGQKNHVLFPDFFLE